MQQFGIDCVAHSDPVFSQLYRRKADDTFIKLAEKMKMPMQMHTLFNQPSTEMHEV